MKIEDFTLKDLLLNKRHTGCFILFVFYFYLLVLEINVFFFAPVTSDYRFFLFFIHISFYIHHFVTFLLNFFCSFHSYCTDPHLYYIA